MATDWWPNWVRSWAFAHSARRLSCIWPLLLLTASLQAAESGASGDAARIAFDLPAQTLALALARFSEQSGVSAGLSGSFPTVITRPVNGRYTALEALQAMLAGSRLEAVQIGPRAYRLQRRPADTSADDASRMAPLPELDELVVTASKREQPWLGVPMSLAVVDAAALGTLAPGGGTRAALAFDSATSSTNLGTGRNRQFIRGVADSAFVGPSQATVSIQFDEARLNYNAPDPDLRLVDVERVEILKGPQGPLYGTGALGGVVHVVPKRPVLDDFSALASGYAGSTQHGGVASGGQLMVNAPVRPGALGLRAVAYSTTEAGWIDNGDGRNDANRTRLSGARLALRAQGERGWTLDLQGALQLAETSDSQYTTGAGSQLWRSGILPEPRDDDLYLVSLALRGAIFGADAVFTSSYVRQEANGLQDASIAASLFGATAPARFRDDRAYRLVNNEFRLASGAGTQPGWLLGLAHLAAQSRNTGELADAAGSTRTLLDAVQDTQELAAFGEGSLHLGKRLHATAGLRLSRAAAEDERRAGQSPALKASVVYSATPSFSLDWRAADQRRFYYLRFARAVRPGGLNPAATGEADSRFTADELSNIDLGARLRLKDDRLSVQAALFLTDWQHIQSDYLLANGLVGSRNVGTGRNVGMEGVMRYEPAGPWQVEFGWLAQHARLHEATLPVDGEAVRLPVVPDLRMHLLLQRRMQWGGWSGSFGSRLDFTDSSRLSFEPDLSRRTSGYVTWSASAKLAHAGFEVQLNAVNLLDSSADTFAFGNPFSVRSVVQRTPLQPRSFTLQVSHSW
jgi:iron complex outermembrane recepter protein